MLFTRKNRKSLGFLWIGIGTAVIAERAPADCPTCPIPELEGAGANTNWAEVGYAVALEGDWAVVGAPNDNSSGGVANAGTVYVFKYDSATGSWSQFQELNWNVSACNASGSESPASGDRFGHAVGISGNYIIVGAPLDDRNSKTDIGTGFVFKWNSATSTWDCTQRLASNSSQYHHAGDQIGFSVAITPTWLVLGAPYAEDTGSCTDPPGDCGLVHAYKLIGSTWSYQQILGPSGLEEQDLFGYAVDLSATRLVAGAFHDDWVGSSPCPVVSHSNAGSAWVFTFGGSFWSTPTLLTAQTAGDCGASNELFGLTVSCTDDRVAVTAPYDDNSLGTDAGSAYVLKWNGTAWTGEARVQSFDGGPGELFGYGGIAIQSVTLTEPDPDVVTDRLVVGDVYDSQDASGAVFVYQRDGSAWVPRAKLTSPDPVFVGYYGWSVAIGGDRALVGQPQLAGYDDPLPGEVYVRCINFGK
jgi:hypothetical protein